MGPGEEPPSGNYDSALRLGNLGKMKEKGRLTALAGFGKERSTLPSDFAGIEGTPMQGPYESPHGKEKVLWTGSPQSTGWWIHSKKHRKKGIKTGKTTLSSDLFSNGC